MNLFGQLIRHMKILYCARFEYPKFGKYYRANIRNNQKRLMVCARSYEKIDTLLLVIFCSMEVHYSNFLESFNLFREVFWPNNG